MVLWMPGSHRWPDAAIESLLQAIDFETVDAGSRVPTPAGPLPEALRGQVRDVTMEAGSVIVFHPTADADQPAGISSAMFPLLAVPWPR